MRFTSVAGSGARCSYCGTELTELCMDHVVPRSRGGSDAPDNLMPACRECNSSKCAMTLEEYRNRLAERALQRRIGMEFPTRVLRWLLAQEWFPYQLEPVIFAYELPRDELSAAPACGRGVA